jgi:hypothetical protein
MGYTVSQPERMSDDWGGPYVAAALFCGEARRDPDGRWCFIDIRDGSLEYEVADSSAEPLLVVMLAGGRNRGLKQIEIIGRRPGGTVAPVAPPAELSFDGPGVSHTLITPIVLAAHSEGRYWFDVRVDGRLATKITFSIQHQHLAETE